MQPDLQTQYRRIQMVKEMYVSPEMKELVAVMYRLGVEFLYRAVHYYSIGTFQRMCRGVTRPPSIHLATKISEIETAVGEIRKEMEMLDGIRLHKIEQKVDAVAKNVQLVQKEVQLIKEDVEASRNIEDNSRIANIRKALQLDPRIVDISLQVYGNDLSQTFEGIKRLPPFNAIEKLFGNSNFIDWRKNDYSSLFLLHGSTVAPNQTIYSWSSPAAVEIVHNFGGLFDSEETIFLRHFCQTSDDWEVRQHKVAPSTVLSSFILQLLNSETSKLLLRNEEKYAELKDQIEAFTAIQSYKSTERVGKLFSVFGKIMRDIKAAKIVIVLDRVDRIEGDLYRFLDPLMAMLKSDERVLKVFLTLRAPYAFEDGHIKDTLGRKRYTSLAIHQDE